MRIEERTFTETLRYPVFDVGEKVRPGGGGSMPVADGIYTVAEFFHPTHAADDAFVFLDGFPTCFRAWKFVPADAPKEDETCP